MDTISIPDFHYTCIPVVRQRWDAQTEYYCSTTGGYFVPDADRIQVIGPSIWIQCPLCDAYRRTALDTGYNPDNPKWHSYSADMPMIEEAAR